MSRGSDVILLDNPIGENGLEMPQERFPVPSPGTMLPAEVFLGRLPEALADLVQRYLFFAKEILQHSC